MEQQITFTTIFISNESDFHTYDYDPNLKQTPKNSRQINFSKNNLNSASGDSFLSDRNPLCLRKTQRLGLFILLWVYKYFTTLLNYLGNFRSYIHSIPLPNRFYQMITFGLRK